MPISPDRFYTEILRAADEERLHIRPVCGQDEAGYDEAPGDRYDGSFCTDEANEMWSNGLLRRVGNRFVITSAGRGALARWQAKEG